MKEKGDRWGVMWQTLRGGWQNLVLVVALYTIVLFFRPSPQILIGGIPVLFSFVDGVRTWRGSLERDPWRVLKSAVFSLVFLYALFIVSYWVGAWGLFGIVVFGIGIGVYAIIRQWRLFLWWMEYIEREYLYGETIVERKQRKEEER